ncbi:response regulator [Antarcticibacterium flavum]|uniref:Response regulator n=1 Tax=Antarcticibacterium flavum TaxID=2058175 RepID=A0A5B7WXZ0_9FLAO|nr:MULTISPECIES: response regulator [Antarcticibacterium]MCM4160849.1 transcriptional regulator [Antarcticibacterium sp. W02-3]QCY68016.1 response regulator [Antarcticibacterium flavum]
MKKILIIEDDEILRENTRELLELSNFNVITAINGKIGVQKALDHQPDLILCDILMPVWDGYKVLEILRAREETKLIPFLFLTAKTDMADIRFGMNLGADDYITKPFKENELVQAIQSRLEKFDLLLNPAKGKFKDSRAGRISTIEELKAHMRLKGEVLHFRRKGIIYREEDHATNVYLLEKGIIKCCKMDSDGKELITALYKKGEFFGFYSFRETLPYGETTTALEGGKAYFIPRQHFVGIFNENPDLTLEFANLFTDALTHMREHLLETAYGSVHKKTVHTLLQFAEKMLTEKSDTIKVARNDLASVAGISTESLIRSLAVLKREHLIEIDGRSIKFLNFQKLQNLI